MTALEPSIMLKKTTEQFIIDAKKIHGNEFDYSLVNYKGAKIPIKIKCLNDHIFEQKPNDHLNGFGCKICAGWGVLKENPKEFIKRSKQIHENKYIYDKTEYINHTTYLIITCKIHGDFKITPKEHLIKKAGCQICGKLKSAKSRTWNKEKFLKKAKEIHGNIFDYSKVEYLTASTKIDIICKKHGIFTQYPKDHINQKQGCPSCCISKGEKVIKEYLIKNNIHYIREYKFDKCINPKTNKKLPFDFYLPNYNLCIEYHGEQHYKKIEFFEKRSGGFVELKKRDKIKEKFCKLNNINYIKISYKEFNQINQKIKNKLCQTL